MAINVADNFSYKGSKPLDARIKYETVSAMAGAATADLYDGCLAYVAATKKYYSYDSSNTTDPTTGKWREYSSGGGGTEYTAGDGIVIEDGEISTDNMPSADMSEIVTPLPGVMSRRFKYSTEEQVVGEWIDGKPIYQKTIIGTTPSNVDVNTPITDVSSWNIDKGISIEGCFMPAGSAIIPINYYYSANNYAMVHINDHSQLTMILGFSEHTNKDLYVTLRYTKTTD